MTALVDNPYFIGFLWGAVFSAAICGMVAAKVVSEMLKSQTADLRYWSIQIAELRQSLNGSKP